MRHPRARWTCPAPAVLSMLLFPALTGNASCQAQEEANVLPETQAGREIVVELEELGPIKRNRQIHTTNLHFLFRMKSFDIGDFKTLHAEEKVEVRRVDLAIALDRPKLLQLNHDFPPGLRLRQDIRLFLSLA